MDRQFVDQLMADLRKLAKLVEDFALRVDSMVDPKTCKSCGQDFVRQVNDKRWGVRVYCSDTCRVAYNNNRKWQKKDERIANPDGH